MSTHGLLTHSTRLVWQTAATLPPGLAPCRRRADARRWLPGAALVGLALFQGAALCAAENALLSAKLATVTTDDLKRHVDFLAADTFEGREAGSRGGRAAGVYVGQHLQRHGLAGGAGASYYQSFGANYRNALGLLPGADPELREQVVVVSAHYDHVGYGTRENSFGPIGYIHNGADDNASGDAALLEVIEAFCSVSPPPRRSLLFAFWDGEEKGLLGSYHWLEQPTIPLARVACLVNMDMVGRLREHRLEVLGTRASPGVRKRLALLNHEPDLLLDFSWEMKDNSDHYPFFQRGLPAFMLHTGLHDDYHRPSDDPETLNVEGMQQVTRLLVRFVQELADGPDLAPFREAARRETPEARTAFEQPLPPLPGRLGVLLEAGPGPGVVLAGVEPGSPAEQAGLQSGDRLLEIQGQPLRNEDHLRSLVLAAGEQIEVTLERPQQPQTVRVPVLLAGKPIRLGISWRYDAAEPEMVALSRVVPGSPAHAAGLAPNDRIYTVDGQGFTSSDAFRQLAEQGPPLSLEVERMGQVRTVRVEPAPEQPSP